MSTAPGLQAVSQLHLLTTCMTAQVETDHNANVPGNAFGARLQQHVDQPSLGVKKG